MIKQLGLRAGTRPSFSSETKAVPCTVVANRTREHAAPSNAMWHDCSSCSTSNANRPLRCDDSWPLVGWMKSTTGWSEPFNNHRMRHEGPTIAAAAPRRWMFSCTSRYTRPPWESVRSSLSGLQTNRFEFDLCYGPGFGVWGVLDSNLLCGCWGKLPILSVWIVSMLSAIWGSVRLQGIITSVIDARNKNHLRQSQPFMRSSCTDKTDLE